MDRRRLHQLHPGRRLPGRETTAGQAVAEAGLSVPDDISVAGYDNTTFAALGPISLTSVDQAGRDMGHSAVRLLLDRITDRRRPTTRGVLSPTLVPRRTTAPPAERGSLPSP
ncbi:substrate-binding domain-containing protein [Streptomyces coeruleorubidus]|uniref:substrate-binding domain-containing protein n=1 Tax=Streptomyces coeruleorubidus TaxID=116188 RepID=UPI0019967AF1|nr:substrate-binding domain-containing protein [Streptomyces bellus]GGT97981.1 hypothetical protein GCM10010244_24430 [Streptomyces bellus]